MNIPSKSKGFSLTNINMYIFHIHFHVKKHVANITFSIILKVKVPTFSSFLDNGYQTEAQSVHLTDTILPTVLKTWSKNDWLRKFYRLHNVEKHMKRSFLQKCKCYNVFVSWSTRVWWPMPETSYHQQRMLYSWFGY